MKKPCGCRYFVGLVMHQITLLHGSNKLAMMGIESTALRLAKAGRLFAIRSMIRLQMTFIIRPLYPHIGTCMSE